jgi:prophage regulatory protein
MVKKLVLYDDLKALGIPFSRQWVATLVREGKFPTPFKLGDGGTGLNAWFAEEIDAYIASKAAARKSAWKPDQETEAA